jgi:hypothetical protein
MTNKGHTYQLTPTNDHPHRIIPGLPAAALLCPQCEAPVYVATMACIDCLGYAALASTVHIVTEHHDQFMHDLNEGKIP